jgi:ATP-dependent DNA helicase RecG
MSATPIPRTLSLIIYGDLKLSVLDELPPGRQPVETLVIHGNKRERAMSFIRDNLDAGRQAYVVCPLIEQGEADTGLRPATEYKELLEHGALKDYRLGLLHGRMKPKEKEETMRAFKSGELQALVSTTVVEVGVDVPNATIILIENAERFGLSQLHQLRGRVGRGKEKSWCILVSDSRSEPTRERLRVMKDTNNGFVVAEHDLKLRGPGDFFGHRQHGLPELRVASLADDMQAMEAARKCADEILADDPALDRPAHRELKLQAERMMEAVGGRPN